MVKFHENRPDVMVALIFAGGVVLKSSKNACPFPPGSWKRAG